MAAVDPDINTFPPSGPGHHRASLPTVFATQRPATAWGAAGGRSTRRSTNTAACTPTACRRGLKRGATLVGGRRAAAGRLAAGVCPPRSPPSVKEKMQHTPRRAHAPAHSPPAHVPPIFRFERRAATYLSHYWPRAPACGPSAPRPPENRGTTVPSPFSCGPALPARGPERHSQASIAVSRLTSMRARRVPVFVTPLLPVCMRRRNSPPIPLMMRHSAEGPLLATYGKPRQRAARHANSPVVIWLLPHCSALWFGSTFVIVC